MKFSFIAEFAIAAKQGPRLFFAPLIGAIHGVRDELRRIDDYESSLVRPKSGTPREGDSRFTQQDESS